MKKLKFRAYNHSFFFLWWHNYLMRWWAFPMSIFWSLSKKSIIWRFSWSNPLNKLEWKLFWILFIKQIQAHDHQDDFILWRWCNQKIWSSPSTKLLFLSMHSYFVLMFLFCFVYGANFLILWVSLHYTVCIRDSIQGLVHFKWVPLWMNCSLSFYPLLMCC